MTLFTQHPASVNEHYCEHFKVAATFSAKLLCASMVCIVHAVFPFLFEKTGTKIVQSLYQEMLEKRQKQH